MMMGMRISVRSISIGMGNFRIRNQIHTMTEILVGIFLWDRVLDASAGPVVET